MFNSISNNFGAGVIQFKDVQEEDYIVLNAKFTYRPSDEAYRAASVLEITVPALTIGRSTETGVVVRFKKTVTSYGSTSRYDGGTFAKSWVKDAQTLCIEKLAVLEEHEEVIVYIQALYCQLGRNANATKSLKKSVTLTSDGSYLYFGYDTFCVLTDRWVFLHLMFSGCTYAKQKADWEAVMGNFPEDVAADVPVIAAYNYQYPLLGGITESRIEEGYWTLPAEERGVGFFNTGSDVFQYAFLVRDSEPEPEVEGRLRIAEDPIKGTGYVQMSSFDLEVMPEPIMAAVAGRTGQYGKTTATLYPQSVPENMPSFKAYHLGAILTGQGLGIQLVEMKMDAAASTPEIVFSGLSGERNLAINLFDTATAAAL